jgi:hypothetical protein
MDKENNGLFLLSLHKIILHLNRNKKMKSLVEHSFQIFLATVLRIWVFLRVYSSAREVKEFIPYEGSDERKVRL